MKGKRVLDLSCGTGVCGIAAARLFEVARATFADLGPMTALVEENVERNGVKGDIFEFKWGDDPTVLKGPFDVVLLSDVVVQDYAKHHPALFASLLDLCHDETEIVLVVELRAEKDKLFFRQARECGFGIEDVTESRSDPRFKCDEIRLFLLRKSYGEDDALYLK